MNLRLFYKQLNIFMIYGFHFLEDYGECHTTFTLVQFICVILSIELRCIIFIPNCTFLVRFGSTSGEFGRAMVCFWRDVIELKYLCKAHLHNKFFFCLAQVKVTRLYLPKKWFGTYKFCCVKFDFSSSVPSQNLTWVQTTHSVCLSTGEGLARHG